MKNETTKCKQCGHIGDHDDNGGFCKVCGKHAAGSVSERIAEGLKLWCSLKIALDNLYNFECRRMPGCADESSCTECWRLAHAIERLEVKIETAEGNLDELRFDAEQDEARAAGDLVDCAECDDDLPTAQAFGCEHCAEVMHTACYYGEHSCHGTRGDAAEAERIEQGYR